PTLRDTAKVNRLNDLCNAIVFGYGFNEPGFKTRGDSVIKYANLAYQEADRIGYKYGMAMSLISMVLGQQLSPSDPKLVNKEAVEGNLAKALAIAEEMQDNFLLGAVYEMKGGVDNWNKAATYYRKAGNQGRELECLTNIVWNFTEGEESVEGIEYADRAIQVAKQIKPANAWEQELVQWAYSNMSELYKTAGDYETSMEYVKKSDSIGKATNWMREYYNICELYYLLGKYDSARLYWNEWKRDSDTYHFGFKAKGELLLGKICIKTGEYDKAIDLINQGISTIMANRKGDRVHARRMVRPNLGLGEAYAGKKDFKTALKYARIGMGYANTTNDKKGKVEGYDLMSRIHHELGNNDSAYLYVKSYVALKDSVQNNQFRWRLNYYKKGAEVARSEARIGLLIKDNQIKEQQLKQQETFRKFLIGLLLALVFAGVFIFRNLALKRKNDKLKQAQEVHEFKIRQLESQRIQTELERQAAELEMQALRAQMNPHFIFNCLSSINRFILKNESKTASNYLTRFSRLIRMVLINSTKQMITLEDDLQMLRLYLEMEQMRFKDSFEFSITFQNVIDDDNIFMPPLLIQPFCENAIWHGLMHMDGPGKLEISLGLENNILHCTITDDGVGRAKAEEIKSKSAEKEKSLGLKITTDRLALLNKEKGVNTSYKIEDLYDENGNAAGTRVELMICFKETMEEIVS
ncbi:MAG TPA: histidine kinase, partial [Chitinophagaceae bacterium]|nr:histidine kinase [Chitinophagaceae bacterium]